MSGRAQGTTYTIQYYADYERVEQGAVDSLLEVIDRSMSLYREGSLINRFNNMQEGSLVLDEHMLRVVKQSFDIYKHSNGLFDITVKPLLSFWGFGAERLRHAPKTEQLDSILKFVGMDKLAMRGSMLSKKDNRLGIDLNGIAQGYSVDVLAALLEKAGVRSYMVELGGEIKTRGYKADQSTFDVAIERPEGSSASHFVLSLHNRAVTTSGNYRKVFDYNGRKIHHHINPNDGYPIQNSVASVTVIAKEAMLADGYDNVFMAMSPTAGIALANKMKDIEIYIIYNDGTGFEELFSKGFHRYIKK